jgi:two-component system sensor histidine kinase/response regulator
LSFRLKTILGIALIEGLLLLLLVYTSVSYLKESNQTEIEKRAQLTVSLFSVAAKEALIELDKPKLTSLAKELSRQQEIDYVYIHKGNDLIVAMHKEENTAIWGGDDVPVSNNQAQIFNIEMKVSDLGKDIGTVQIGFDRSGFDELLLQASTRFFSIAALEMLLVALFSWLFGIYLTRNLSELQKASKLILEGQKGVQIPVSGHDEIAQTTVAFNQMVLNIDARTNALTGANIRLNTILESAADGFVIIDVEGVITEVNNSVTRLFGYTKDELVGQNVAKLMPMHERHMHDGYMKRYLEGGKPRIIGTGRELTAQHKEGHQFPVELSISKMVIDDEILFLGFLKDLTTIKKNQEAAVRTQSILLATLEASQDALITIDITGRIQEFNTAAVKLFGYSRDEVIGQYLEELIIPKAFQQAHKKGMEHFRKTAQGAVLHKRVEVPAHNKAGEEFPIELRVIPIQLGDDILFTAFLRDISEQKSKEEELRLAKEQAEAGSKAKSRFLATMSHEIRSPLNAVLGSVELLLDSALQKEQCIYATTAKEAGDALLNTINDILDFSKIEAGQMVLESREFEPDKLVAQVLQILAGKALEKGVHLASLINRNVPKTLVGDPQRLRQVIHNLVDNAIKFSSSGCITVEVWIPNSHKERVELCCAISDQGIGISKEAQEKLFAEFSQVHDTDTTNYKGTGLGLAISAELVRMMDGTISVESELGAGSRFTVLVTLDESTQSNSHNVRLPEHSKVLVIHPDKQLCKLVKKQYEQYGVQTIYIQDVTEIYKLSNARGRFVLILLDDSCMMSVDTKLLKVLDQDFLFPHGILAALSTGVNTQVSQLLNDMGIEQVVNKPLSRAMLLNLISGATQENHIEIEQEENAIFPLNSKILLAEDSLVNQMVAGTMLAKKGAFLDYANNGVEAVQMALANDYDIILMDIRMPEMDGLEATSKILQRKPQQIILAMTANVFKEELEAFTQVGMLDFIGKPVNGKMLIQSVSQWLHKAKLQQEADKTSPNLTYSMGQELTHEIKCDSDVAATETESSQPLAKSIILYEKGLTQYDHTPLIDNNVINSLIEAIGEPSLHKMLDVFCQETQMRIGTLGHINPAEDFIKIEDEAHTLKSSSGSFGAGRLYEVAKVLEAAAREKQQPIAPLIADTLNIAAQSIAALKQAYLSNK